jgi:glycosyltransferase involved in cell wall biosynthesis
MTGMGEIAAVADPVALAERILAVLESPASYRRPREEIRAMFSTERTLTEYEAVYRSAGARG